MDTTFSDDEKRFILGEIIKVSAIDVSTLVGFIKAQNVAPNWLLMQLPVGRNMSQCLGAADNMFQIKFPPPSIGNLDKRKSLGDLNDYPSKRPASAAPFEPTLATVRALQPRPSLSNGYPLSVAPIANTPVIPSTGKKRGRPSKADKEAAQAQARAAYTRPPEYPHITPAPPAPPMAQPQREYASSPGYEITSSNADQNPKKRPRPTAVDSPRQASGSFPLASPVSTTGTPRALPEPLEQIERANMSPRAVDSRSPPLPPLLQHHDQAPAHPHILPRLQPTPIPVQPSSSRPLPAYEQYRVPDPIFPDRDRSRSMPDQVSRNASASPVVNRT